MGFDVDERDPVRALGARIVHPHGPELRVCANSSAALVMCVSVPKASPSACCQWALDAGLKGRPTC